VGTPCRRWPLSSGWPGRDLLCDCLRIFSAPPDSFGFAGSSSTSLEFQSVLLLAAGHWYFPGSSRVPGRDLWETAGCSDVALRANLVAVATHR
jgi:hypothetical protein